MVLAEGRCRTSFSLSVAAGYFGKIARWRATRIVLPPAHTPLQIRMEGASSIVEILPDGWVRKTQKRSARRKRITPSQQERLQAWVATHCSPANGYHYLFSPVTRESPAPHSYEMRSVDTSADPWFLETLPRQPYEEDLDRLSAAFKAATGFRLYDVELYLQPDGRVAVLDYDQCELVLLR